MSLSAVVAVLVLTVAAVCSALAAGVAGVLHRLDGATLPTAAIRAASTFVAAFATSIAALTLLASWTSK
ncbi:hypothetical protein ABT112_02180 [Streptomyces sp. NPDC002055]|uniref:hypothetical protein n=1 Tax=Streptomyces sp. NPDC002055 TaxID=3154534 RepID=UPI0033278CF3